MASVISGGSNGVVAVARSRSRLFATAFAFSTSRHAGMLRLSLDSQKEGSEETGNGGSNAFSGPGLTGEEMDDDRLEVGHDSKAGWLMASSLTEWAVRDGFLDVRHRERLWKRDPNRVAIPEIVES